MQERIQYPKRLRQGDCIGMVCPSSGVPEEKVDQAKQVLEELGYQVKVGKSCFLHEFGYLAGTPQQRAEDVNEMFADNEVDAIFCMRGGYGGSDILELLDYSMISCHPKIFVGYSDITSIHAALFTKCHLATIHGPMVKSNMISDYDSYTRSCFEEILAMKQTAQLKNPSEDTMVTIQPGIAKGRLVGGNLAVFINLIGTCYAPGLKDKILFIEDIGESVPRLHRMLQQLRLLHVFEQLAGVMIGNFTDCPNDAYPEFGVQQLMEYTFADVKIPVLSNVCCGHCTPTASLLLGSYCIMNATDHCITFCKE